LLLVQLSTFKTLLVGDAVQWHALLFRLLSKLATLVVSLRKLPWSKISNYRIGIQVLYSGVLIGLTLHE